ncbi:hypothetical protein THAR02_08766 [Trichoderma harzianum]|uniref:Uncharacterized protein n=1 Tax=Trichoderma harzianum TaxID=5544 RepID=A0A0F9XEQ9_TRIHA|nr:hypothetical protein THAR02_08766 [Trichoderma harzianum]
MDYSQLTINALAAQPIALPSSTLASSAGPSRSSEDATPASVLLLDFDISPFFSHARKVHPDNVITSRSKLSVDSNSDIVEQPFQKPRIDHFYALQASESSLRRAFDRQRYLQAWTGLLTRRRLPFSAAFLLASSKDALIAALEAADDTTGDAMYKQFYEALNTAAKNESSQSNERKCFSKKGKYLIRTTSDWPTSLGGADLCSKENTSHSSVYGRDIACRRGGFKSLPYFDDHGCFAAPLREGKEATYDPHLLHCVDMGWFVLNKYYALTDETPAYAAAPLLDPSKRLQYIQPNWNISWIDNVVVNTRRFWEENYKEAGLSKLQQQTSPKSVENITIRPIPTTVSTTCRHHLFKIHGIELDAQDHPIKKQRNSLIQDAFAKAGETSSTRHLLKHEETLRAAVNRKAALEALVQLVTVRNLSYNCSSWLELHALVSAVNYTAQDLISLSHDSIQKLVSNSYCVHKDVLRRKLQSSPSKLHLSADVWSAPNQKAFLGICVKCIDPDSKETLQALLALPELPGLDGPGGHGGAEQWELLQPVLEDYNIWNKVGFYTGDNHGSNDKLCRLLDEHLQAKGINWEPTKQRI